MPGPVTLNKLLLWQNTYPSQYVFVSIIIGYCGISKLFKFDPVYVLNKSMHGCYIYSTLPWLVSLVLFYSTHSLSQYLLHQEKYTILSKLTGKLLKNQYDGLMF